MARSLIIPNPGNATIEDIKVVCRRIWLIMKVRWFNNYVYKNEEQLIERLDQAILDVVNNPNKTQRTTDFGTLF